MTKHFYLLTLVALFAVLLLPANATDEFPGKGKKADWDRANAYNDRSVLLADSGDYDKAETQARQAIKTYPYEAIYFQSLGRALRKEGKLSEAESAYRNGISLNAELWDLWFGLSITLAQEKKLSEAVLAAQKALTCNPPADKKDMITHNIKLFQSDIADSKREAVSKAPGDH